VMAITKMRFFAGRRVRPWAARMSRFVHGSEGPAAFRYVVRRNLLNHMHHLRDGRISAAYDPKPTSAPLDCSVQNHFCGWERPYRTSARLLGKPFSLRARDTTTPGRR
jgi:hypothetical protein